MALSPPYLFDGSAPEMYATFNEREAGTSNQHGRRVRPKVFYVGDNRTMANWGRAASIALSESLSEYFDFSGRITGDWFVLDRAEAGYVRTLMPPKHYRIFREVLAKRTGAAWRRWYIKLEEAAGAIDFITEEPSESVDHLVANRHRYPALEKLYQEALQSDALVLDGDGDIIFSTPPRRQTLFLLAMIELGERLNKPTFLVNSMISDCPLSGRNQRTLSAARRLLAKCKGVVLRDPESLEYVRREAPEANATYIPDSLFAWYRIYSSEASRPPVNGDFLQPYPENGDDWGKLDFSTEYICVGGGALAGSQPERAIRAYSELIGALGDLGYRVYLTENDVSDGFLRTIAREKNIGFVPVNAPILLCGAVLAHSRLFISGRYHPSIFASLGGAPCIFLGSHAHKMASLSQVLEYKSRREFSAFPTTAEIGDIVALARQYLEEGQTLRRQIRQVAEQNGVRARGLAAFLRRQIPHTNGNAPASE